MNLLDLPQFTITGFQGPRVEGQFRILGHLSHLTGVRNRRGALYAPNALSILGDLETAPTLGEPVIFHALSWSNLPSLAVGGRLPWLDGYWQPYQLEMVLDPGRRWVRRLFQVEPAHFFELNGVRGWQKVGGELPKGARDLGIQEGQWDHEHCDIRQDRIGGSAGPEGFLDENDNWVCTGCYHRYVAPHDIAFTADA